MADLLQFPATSTAGTIPDAGQREQALDTSSSWIVEAPAGSGKTGLLIQRFLKLLAAENVTQPAQVLAITFTRKATSEMRDRVFHQLADAHTGDEPANDFDRLTRPLAHAVLLKDRQLGWNLLEDPRRLNIRTIDSVCADIARGLPVLSGSGGGQAPTEDAAALHTEAAHRTLMLLGGPDASLNAALEDLLLHRDGNLANCESLIAAMLGWREQWGELVPLAPSELTDHYLDTIVLSKLDRALDLAICRSLTELTRVMPAHLLERLCHLAAEMAHSDGYQGGSSPVALCAGRLMPPEEKAAHLDHWNALLSLLLTKGGDFRAAKGINVKNLEFMIEKRHKAELISILDELRPEEQLREILCRIRNLPPAEYPREQWPTAKSFFRVLSRALVELQFVFASTGECDFTESALQARSALRRDGSLDDLRLSSTLDLQHLLVDEMQDTSSAQYELIQLLTERWDGHGQTVFLVGDPKQSIYLFRQARVERFVQTMHSGLLGDLPLGTLHLSSNFRSQQKLVQAFNQTFSVLFPSLPDAARPEIVPYRAASAIRPSTPAAAEVWHATVLPQSDDKAVCQAQRKAQVRAHAQQIREIAAQWLAKPLPEGRKEAWKLAVLVRNRTHLIEIVAAFKQAPAIPYRAVKIEPLAERQEVLDLLALTRALLHPADRIAWLALLRTPWCGLALADLHTLAGSDDPAFSTTNILTLIETRGELLSPDGIARLEPFWQIMSAAVSMRARLSIARTVELTWRSFAGHTVATVGELANTERYLHLLAELEATGILDLSTLDARLAQLYATPAAAPGAVDLMTMHGAKGLEWDVVFVPALERVGATNSGRLLSWLETGAETPLSGPEIAPGILAPIKSKGGDGEKLNDWMRSVESGREAAERTRLFYVACTRAREELHLFATLEEKKSGELAPPAASLLVSAWAAAQPHFTPAAPTSVPQLSVPHSSQPHRDEWEQPLALAAAATEHQPNTRTIARIPTASMTAVPVPFPGVAPQAFFARPEGSFAARVFGNTMHTFLDLLATRIAAGQSAGNLAEDVPSWQPRIAAILRNAGLPSALLGRYTGNILRGLNNTLHSPEGRWLLASHPNAASEQTLTHSHDGSIRSLRLDRTFLAGPDALSTGTTHLWIVDYKTATHGAENLPEFLAKEETRYRPQMEAYAAELRQKDQPIRLALFYPMLAKLHLMETLAPAAGP